MIGTHSSAPEADFREHPGGFRAVPCGGDDGRDGERCCGAQNRPDIVRIGDLIEHEHNTGGGQILERGSGEGIGFGEEALMHGVGRQPRRDGVGAYQLRRR